MVKTYSRFTPEDCGVIIKSSRVSLTKYPPKGYSLFSAVDLDLDGQDPSRGRRAAGRPGAGAGAVERHGRRRGAPRPRQLLVSEHQIINRDHGRVEESVAISPRGSARPRSEQRERAGRRLGYYFGEIRFSAAAGSRARFFDETERECAGVGA